MRLRFVLPLLILAAPAAAAPIGWVHNPEVLVPGSSDSHLLLFFDDGSRSARRMGTWTFTDPEVVEAMTLVTPIHVERSHGPGLARHFHVAEWPTLLLITPRGQEMARLTGLVEAPELLTWLHGALARMVPSSVVSPTDSAEATPEVFDPYLGAGETPPPASTDVPLAQREVEIEIRFRPVTSAAPGIDIPLQVHVPGGADSVRLHFRSPRQVGFYDVQMSPNTPTLFYGVIPGDAVTAEGLEYYISVMRQGQTVMNPLEGPGRPHRIVVR